MYVPIHLYCVIDLRRVHVHGADGGATDLQHRQVIRTAHNGGGAHVEHMVVL